MSVFAIGGYYTDASSNETYTVPAGKAWWIKEFRLTIDNVRDPMVEIRNASGTLIHRFTFSVSGAGFYTTTEPIHAGPGEQIIIRPQLVSAGEKAVLLGLVTEFDVTAEDE